MRALITGRAIPGDHCLSRLLCISWRTQTHQQWILLNIACSKHRFVVYLISACQYSPTRARCKHITLLPEDAHGAFVTPHYCSCFSSGQVGVSTSFHQQCTRTGSAECGVWHRQFSIIRLPSLAHPTKDTSRQIVLRSAERAGHPSVAWIWMDTRGLR